MNPVLFFEANFTAEQRREQNIAVTVVRVTLVLGLALHSTLLLMHMVSYRTLKKKFTWTNPGHRLRFWQALSALYMTIFFAMAVAEYFVDWRFMVKECYDMIIAHIFFYILFKQSVDFFLYERAKVVHASLLLNDKNLIRLRWGIWCAVLALGPGFAWNALVVSYGPLILFDGYCNQAMQSVPTAIVLAVADFFLGMAMLGLFVAPLRARQKDSTSQPTQKTSRLSMQALVMKNLVLSSVIGVSGLVGILTYVGIFSSDWRNPENGSLAVWGYWVATLDMIVSQVCIHALAKAWIAPISCGMCVNRESDHQDYSSNGRASPSSPASWRKMVNTPGKRRIADIGSVEISPAAQVKPQ